MAPKHPKATLFKDTNEQVILGFGALEEIGSLSELSEEEREAAMKLAKNCKLLAESYEDLQSGLNTIPAKDSPKKGDTIRLKKGKIATVIGKVIYGQVRCSVPAEVNNIVSVEPLSRNKHKKNKDDPDWFED